LNHFSGRCRIIGGLLHAKTGGDLVLKGLLLARQLVELVEQALRIHLGADSHDRWEDCGWKRLAGHGKHGSQHFIDNADQLGGSFKGSLVFDQLSHFLINGNPADALTLLLHQCCE